MKLIDEYRDRNSRTAYLFLIVRKDCCGRKRCQDSLEKKRWEMYEVLEWRTLQIESSQGRL